MSRTSDGRLQCDWRKECANEPTHLGAKGYIYCASCVGNRRGIERYRRMTKGEIATLRADGRLTSFERPKRKARTAPGGPEAGHADHGRAHGVLPGLRSAVEAEQVTVPLFAPPPEGWVYLIEAVGRGRVKIGWAKDAEARLAALQTGSADPLRLVGKFPGSQADERAMHKRFASARSGGEWFMFTPEIREFAARGAT